MDETLDNGELVCTKTDGTKYNFKTFALPLKFAERIYNYKITLNEAKENQDKLENLIIRLEKYNAKKGKRKYERKKVLESAVKLFRARKDIINFFEKGIFPFKGNVFKTKEGKSEETKEEIKEEFINNALVFTEKKSKDINNDLFKTYSNFLRPEFLEEIKNRRRKLKNQI